MTESPLGLHAVPATFARELSLAEQDMTEDEKIALEEAVGEVITAVMRLDRSRNIHYKTLAFCTEPRRAGDVEDYIAAMPEMVHALQEPYVYMDAMVDAGGLSATPLDTEGNPVDMEAFDAAPEEERADMIADYEIAITQAGTFALSALAPAARMTAKFGEKPERYTTFLAVLDFCREPRTLAEVKRLFEEDATLNRETTVDRQPLSCDFYLSELERAGGIVWDGGWVCTDEGRAFLAAAQA